MTRMYDPRTGRELGVRSEQPVWRSEGVRHTLFIPQTIPVPDGRAAVGGIDTGIAVYPSREMRSCVVAIPTLLLMDPKFN